MILGSIVMIAGLLTLIYFVGYNKAFYCCIIITVLLLVFNFGFAIKAANNIFGIDVSIYYSYEEMDQNIKKVQPFLRFSSGLLFSSILSLFIASIVNLFVLNETIKISLWLSWLVFISTLCLVLFLTLFLMLASSRYF